MNTAPRPGDEENNAIVGAVDMSKGKRVATTNTPITTLRDIINNRGSATEISASAKRCSVISRSSLQNQGVTSRSGFATNEVHGRNEKQVNSLEHQMACRRKTTDETAQMTTAKASDHMAAKFIVGGKCKTSFLTPQSNDEV